MTLLGVLYFGLLVIVPVADAGIGLPRVGRNPSGNAALQVQDAGPGLAILRGLAGIDGLHLATVPLGVGVIQMRHQAEPIFLEGNPAVSVEQVGLVVVHQILDAFEIELLPGVGRDPAHGLRELA